MSFQEFKWIYKGITFKVTPYIDTRFIMSNITKIPVDMNINKLVYVLKSSRFNPDFHDRVDGKVLHSYKGGGGDDVIVQTGGSIFPGAGNDTVTAIARDAGREMHVYAGPGNDVIKLQFQPPTGLTSGHHVEGDSKTYHAGSDTIIFENINSVGRHVAVGRLEDFDPTWDTLKIGSRTIDLTAPPPDVKIVAFNGSHNDTGTGGVVKQRWMVIENDHGGKIFYALDGARINMQHNGGVEGSRVDEDHFLRQNFWEAELRAAGKSYSVANIKAYIDKLEEVSYENDFNFIPKGLTPVRGISYTDTDNSVADVSAAIGLTSRGAVDPKFAGNDLIAAGINDDTVHAGAGNDQVWGGSGYDTIRGDSGNDILWGNSGRDTLIGGDGNDRLDGGTYGDKLYGSTGNDVILGRTGYDYLFGGNGDDRLYGGHHTDKIWGGAGNDFIYGGTQTDYLRGGTGDDTFYFRDIDGVDRISDLETGIGARGHDVIRINSSRYDSYSDIEDIMSQAGSRVLINFGGGNKIYLSDTRLSEMNADMFDFV